MTDKKGKNKIKDINKFVELSMNMLDDIKNKEREVGSVSEVPAPKIDIKIFEDMRNQFNEEVTPSSIELKE